MISKITCPRKLSKVLHDLKRKFGDEILKYGHYEAPINIETFIKAWGDSRLLNFHLHVWAHEKNGEYDATIMFQNVNDPRIGEEFWTEYFFVSKNHRATIPLLKVALNYGRNIVGRKRFIMGCVENYPKTPKLKLFYEKIGMTHDSNLYIGEFAQCDLI